MAQYSELKENVTCPYCENVITSISCFQWGAIPKSYVIGDRIKWYKNSEGDFVKPFTLIHQKDKWNSGNPKYENLIILDSNYFAPESMPKCPNCHNLIDGIAIEINNGVIHSVKVLQNGDLKLVFSIESLCIDTIIVENNNFHPRYDLYNHPVIPKS